MLKFRKNSSALIHGKTKFFESKEPILSFSRKSSDENVVCFFNLSKEEVSLPVEGLKEINNHPHLNAKTEEKLLRLGPNGFCFFCADPDKVIGIL